MQNETEKILNELDLELHSLSVKDGEEHEMIANAKVALSVLMKNY